MTHSRIILPKGQKWFIQPANQFGYELDPKGVCNGVAVTAMVMFFDGRLADLDATWMNYGLLLKSGDSLAISSLTDLSPSEKKAQQIHNELVLPIRTMLDAIFIYQCAIKNDLHKSLYEADKYQQSQKELDKSAHLALPKKLQERGGIAQIGIPLTIQLVAGYQMVFFERLETELQQSAKPFAMLLHSKNHTILLGWTPEDGFFIYDANSLPGIYDLSAHELPVCIHTLFNEHNISTFTAYCYCAQDHSANFENIKNWINKQHNTNHILFKQHNHFLDLLDAYQLFRIAVYHHDLLMEANIYQKFPHLYPWLCNFYLACEITISVKEFEIVIAILDHDHQKLSNLVRYFSIYFEVLDHKTPIHIAIEIDNVEALKILLNHCEKIENAYLHLAINYHAHECIEELLHRKNKTETLNDEGLAPIHLSVIKNDVKLLELLIKKNCDIDFKDISSNTALHHAVINNNTMAIRILLQHQASLNVKNDYNETPFQLAIKPGRASLLPLLYSEQITLPTPQSATKRKGKDQQIAFFKTKASSPIKRNKTTIQPKSP